MIAPLALLSWPIVVIILFLRTSAPVAVAVAVIGGYLLLPVQPAYDLPLLPPIDKETLPAFAALVMALIIGRKRPGPRQDPQPGAPETLPGWIPRSTGARLLIALLFVGAFLNVLTNQDVLVYGPTVLPPIGLYNGFSASLGVFMMLIPFLLARKFLSSDEGNRTLLIVLVISGLLYSLLALYEIRMSPQLNVMVYGFFPHQWMQHVRGGGYRPLVFLRHGLWLAIFMAGAVLAALGMMRLSSGRQRTLCMLAAAWLFATLFLSHSLGAFVIAVLASAVLLLCPPRAQLLIAAAIAAVMLTYPILRGAGLIPVDRIVAWADGVEKQRGDSLRFRLANEDILLEKANERPLAGWGSWNRNRVFNENGVDVSVTDGLWVIVIGRDGWIGYIGQFGLLGLPIILLAFRRRSLGAGQASAALALILAGGLIDLIPNGTRTPVTWLVAGALVGRLEWARKTAAEGPALATAAGPEPALPPAQILSGQYSAGYTRQKYLHRRTGA